MKQIFSAIAIMLFISSCKKEDTTYTTTVKGDLSVEFDNIAGTEDLALNTGTYINAASENFTVSKLKYFVSNFVFTNVDGTVYTVPQDSCYFLIDESADSTHEPEMHVPEGEYKSVSFVLGVDSARNTMPESKRTGVLDIYGAALDMYWTWNSGYIFYKMEGSSPASAQPGNVYAYHIGYFGGIAPDFTINNLRTITLDLTTRGTPKVKAGKETNIHLMVDVIKMFSGFSIATHSSVMTDPFSSTIANNFAGMIKHDHTEN